MKTADDKKLEALVVEVELPDSAYDKAVSRYTALGTWLERPESTIQQYGPDVSLQGSFALGTATYPLNRKEDYDLDLTCKLQRGLTRASHTQFQVKEMVRHELQLYRDQRNIEERLEEKRRCWRLQYKDTPGFHMDTVPAIPGDEVRRGVLIQEMRAHGLPEHLLPELAREALWITDNKHPLYKFPAPDWVSSNPAGYVRWFQSRLQGSTVLTEAQAKVDDVPVYRRKLPLQQVIQLLKRHRDVMFERLPDSKPISVIITTIAARSYRAGESLSETMVTVLHALNDFRRSNSNEVLNPVNPKENFADKWTMPEYAQHQLKKSFHDWVEQACNDFTRYAQATSGEQLIAEASRGLKVTPTLEKLAAAFGAVKLGSPPAVHTKPSIEIREPPRPWRKG